MGNTDALLLNPRPYEAVVGELKTAGMTDEDARRVAELDLWCADQLTSTDLDFLRTFKPTLEMPLGGDMTLLCFHGPPHFNTDVIRSATPEDDLERMLSGFRAEVMAGGHTHAQMLRRYRNMTIINPGSVGLPYERVRLTGRVRNPPWAEYAVVDWDNSQLRTEFRRAQVDINKVIRAALDSGMPHAKWWTGYWSLR